MKILSSCCSSKSSVDIVKIDFINKNNFSANDDQSNDCYIFMKTNILEEIITAIGCCSKCSANVNFNHDAKHKKGLSHCIFISCASCQWEQKFYSSKAISKPVKAGPKTIDAYLRIILAFREIGKGYSSIKKFCGLMNMPDPMNKSSFNSLNEEIANSYNYIAEASMNNAAKKYE